MPRVARIQVTAIIAALAGRGRSSWGDLAGESRVGRMTGRRAVRAGQPDGMACRWPAAAGDLAGPGSAEPQAARLPAGNNNPLLVVKISSLPKAGRIFSQSRWGWPHLQPNRLAGYADRYDFASRVSPTGASAWYRREHRGARMPLEMDRSCPAAGQTGAAKAVTVMAMERSFADQIAGPRAVAIDLAAASPGSGAGAQSRLRARFSRRPKGVPPAQPALPGGMAVGPGIELSAGDPLSDYLMELAGAVDIRELESGWPVLTALEGSGAVLVIPLMWTGSPASQEGCDRRVSDAYGESADGALAGKPTAHSGEGTGRHGGEGFDGRAKDEHGRPAGRRSYYGDRYQR